MVNNNEKIRILQCHITKDLHEMFIQKIVSEGWTVQQAIARLILAYVNEENNDNI